MKTYTVTDAIRHADAQQPVKEYQPDDTIELSDEHAAVLLASGHVTGPIAGKAKKSAQ